ncbi:CTL-like protein DDB_G0274487 isoform X2 [Neltuma alba]|uniref:CTL-like protein DDB_G0274487 isoform X2 n=1 Tax=Neltuma alba TaxID=207710 RepID=UPI0010A579CB|nr:CTL-like protein DDB_G0274487 isoform X2 [Prosopis alba]
MMESPSFSSSSSDSSTVATRDQNADRSRRNGDVHEAVTFEQSRRWHDVFWSGIFIIHLISLALIMGVLGLNGFKKRDRLNIGMYTGPPHKREHGLTEDYWPLYAAAGGVGTVLGLSWLLLLGSRANQMMKVSVHILTTYLAVISVLCFWAEQFFWGVIFATGAALQFLYVISVIDRLPFTMLILQKAMKMVCSLPEVMRVAYAFMLVVLLWMAIWSFGASGVVASSLFDVGCWWLLLIFCVSLFWTGAVLCNTVHVIVSGMVFLNLIHGGRDATSIHDNSLIRSLQYALTKSFGSICYGSLFTAAIRTLRWEIRGFRSKIGNNECLLCCVDFLFHLVETLVRFFNKYAYVQIAVNGKSFNRSARDAWELLQSTGVEALVAYDCSGAVLLMGAVCGGLIAGTCSGVWAWYRFGDRDRIFMIGTTSMLMGMVLVGVAMVVVESAVTSIYICYAEDPSLIRRWDTEFFNQMSETLHHRLQHRSARAREVLTNSQLDYRVRQNTSFN